MNIHSGPVYGVTTQTNTCQCFSSGAQRPNLLRNPALPSDQRSVQRWFDTDSFRTAGEFHIRQCGARGGSFAWRIHH